MPNLNVKFNIISFKEQKLAKDPNDHTTVVRTHRPAAMGKHPLCMCGAPDFQQRSLFNNGSPLTND